jgi:hypothetical protein
MRLKTNQDAVMLNQITQDSRLNILETNYISVLKDWTELNFVRKNNK